MSESKTTLGSQMAEMLRAAIDQDASDVHITVGRPVRFRSHGKIQSLEGFPAPTPRDTTAIAARILYQARRGDREEVLRLVEQLQDDDCSLSVPGVGRFRVNLCRQRGTLELVLRVVNDEIPSVDSLGLPAVLKDIALEERGLVLVTGATGSGKSTTLAAMINHINLHRERKIVTIEDPIEYLYRDMKSAITQREVGSDTPSFARALRAALRQDPDVIMVGEMRDRETIDVALKAAETGHLVFSTVHTTDAAKTVNRIISVFDQAEQATVRIRMSDSLSATVAQRLLRNVSGEGRVAAMEIMRVTLSIKNCIENPGKEGINDFIAKGAEFGMRTFDQHLIQLYERKLISLATAKAAATSPNDLEYAIQFT